MSDHPEAPKPALYALTAAQHATVLAALHHYERDMAAGVSLHHVADIATNGGTIAPLIEVGKLAEDLGHAGLEFSEIVNLLGDDDTDPYVRAATNSDLLSEGTLEVDIPTIVSRGDDSGAYVMAWLWVSDAPTGMQEG